MPDALVVNNDVKTADQLHDEAFAATQAWQIETDETKKAELKTTAEGLVKSSKGAYKAEREKAIEEAKKTVGQKPVAPEKYELKLPEGSKLDASHLERIAADAKARGLSQEDAQAEVERNSKAQEAFAKQQDEQVKVYLEKLATEAKADKEIGGEAFVKNSELAKRVVDRFGTEEFKKALNDSGLGNHPELIRVFHRIGKIMSEDQLVLPGTQQKSEKKPAAEVLYGETTKSV